MTADLSHNYKTEIEQEIADLKQQQAIIDARLRSLRFVTFERAAELVLTHHSHRLREIADLKYIIEELYELTQGDHDRLQDQGLIESAFAKL